MTRRLAMLAGGILLAAAGCAPTIPDYGIYLDHLPRSILVLPPINHTAELRASDAFLSVVTQPLAERGYYVFPPAVVDRLMKENGLPTPGEMHQASLRKLGEVFGADAVLYAEIHEWETQYMLINSSVQVEIDYRLVDVKTGTPLWQHRQRVVHNSAEGARDPFTALLAAAVVKAANADAEYERGLAEAANHTIANHRDYGLLIGPRHPEYEKGHALEVERQKQYVASTQPEK